MAVVVLVEGDAVRYVLIDNWAASQYYAKTSDSKLALLINLVTI